MEDKKKPQGKIHLDLEISKISSHAKEEMEGRFCLYLPAVYRKSLTGLQLSKEGKEAGEQGLRIEG